MAFISKHRSRSEWIAVVVSPMKTKWFFLSSTTKCTRNTFHFISIKNQIHLNPKWFSVFLTELMRYAYQNCHLNATKCVCQNNKWIVILYKVHIQPHNGNGHRVPGTLRMKNLIKVKMYNLLKGVAHLVAMDGFCYWTLNIFLSVVEFSFYFR